MHDHIVMAAFRDTPIGLTSLTPSCSIQIPITLPEHTQAMSKGFRTFLCVFRRPIEPWIIFTLYSESRK